MTESGLTRFGCRATTPPDVRYRIAAMYCYLIVAAICAPCPGEEKSQQSSMLHLDNGTVRVGVDRTLGGAITWVSSSGSERNLINSHDFGRQVQMSYYSGPIPFTAGQQRPAAHWKHIGWNPIQSGDDFGNRNGCLKVSHDGRVIHVQCHPRHWPLNDVRANCRFEMTVKLDGPCVQVSCRLLNQRLDKTQYRARDQEMPALYTNGEFYRLMTFTGSRPFTAAALDRIPQKQGPGFPWTRWSATENWAALVDDNDFGIGLWQPDCVSFLGGFSGRGGQGGPLDASTGYIAPIRREIIDHNIRHEYDYRLIVGSLSDIRSYVYRLNESASESFHFDASRHGWYFENASDTGWPIRGALNVRLASPDPQVISPEFFWPQRSESTILIRAAFTTDEDHATLFWRPYGTDAFVKQNSQRFRIIGDGEMRSYEIRLPKQTKPLMQLRFDPVEKGSPGQSVRIKSISRLAS